MDFVLANNADPDEIPHYTAFHLGPHCLPKYLFSRFPFNKGLMTHCQSNVKIDPFGTDKSTPYRLINYGWDCPLSIWDGKMSKFNTPQKQENTYQMCTK